jgi:hypothetical protein
MGRSAASLVALFMLGWRSLVGARRVLVPTVVVAAATAPGFWKCYTTSVDNKSDHAVHLMLIRDGKIPTYPLYHLSVLGVAKCLEVGADQGHAWRSWSPVAAPAEALAVYVDRLRRAAAVVLTLACAATAALSAGYLASRTSASTLAITVTCLGLALAMPLPTMTFLGHVASAGWRFPTPGYSLYMGQISPNVWHNPTTIFAMPFAVALFRVATRAIEGFTLRVAVELAVVAMLSVLAKPNYALALLPCVAVVLALSPHSWIDKLLRLIAAFILPLALLWGQAAVLVGPKGNVGEEMLISPFEVWRHFSGNIPLSALVGIAFPLCIVLAYRGRFAAEAPLKLAWMALGTGVLQYAVLIEGGERVMSGNWAWGMTFADHVLFLASCDFLLRQRADARKVLCYACFLVHVGCGVLSLRDLYRDDHAVIPRAVAVNRGDMVAGEIGKS